MTRGFREAAHGLCATASLTGEAGKRPGIDASSAGEGTVGTCLRRLTCRALASISLCLGMFLSLLELLLPEMSIDRVGQREAR